MEVVFFFDSWLLSLECYVFQHPKVLHRIEWLRGLLSEKLKLSSSQFLPTWMVVSESNILDLAWPVVEAQ